MSRDLFTELCAWHISRVVSNLGHKVSWSMGFAQGVENFRGVFMLGSMAPMKAGVGVQSRYVTHRERTFAFDQRPGEVLPDPAGPPSRKIWLFSGARHLGGQRQTTAQNDP